MNISAPARQRAPRGHGIGVSLFVLALGLIYQFVGDKSFWGEWISVAPPILWVVLLLPTAIRLRSWIVATSLAAFLLFTTEWPRPWNCIAHPREEVVRLISWNIGAGNTNWVEALEQYSPDIVLVQESLEPLRIWEGFEWHEAFDPGVLTRFPTEVLSTEKVGPWTEPQLLLMEIRGKKVLVANVRLMLPSIVFQMARPFTENPLDNHRDRVRQYEKLVKLLKSSAERTGAHSIILGGDFNTPGSARSLEPLTGFLKDAWRSAACGWGATMPEFFPLSRVDQVWVSSDIHPVFVRVVRLAGSDHRGIIMDLLM